MKLSRVLEPEVMDTQEDASEYDAIPNDEVNALFVQECRPFLPNSGQIIDLGTGTARIPILIAQQQPQLKVIGVDLSKEMLNLGIKNSKAAGIQGNVELVFMDVKDTSFSNESFDAVISNSIVHHIPEPVELFREMARIGRFGSGYFIKDLLRPESQEELDHLVETYAYDCNEYQRTLFRNSLHAALSLAEVEQFANEASLENFKISQVSDRHWTLTRPWHTNCKG